MILLLAGILLASGCADQGEPAEVVEEGDYVLVDYTGTLEDGTVFDTSIEEVAIEAGGDVYSPLKSYEPFGFTVGANQTIEGFDRGVIGMEVGETKTLVIPPEDAYGEFIEEETVSLELLDPNATYVAGGNLTTFYGNLTILNVTESNITVDVSPLNHPRAGQTLTFEVTLVSIGMEEEEESADIPGE